MVESSLCVATSSTASTDPPPGGPAAPGKAPEERRRGSTEGLTSGSSLPMLGAAERASAGGHRVERHRRIRTPGSAPEVSLESFTFEQIFSPRRWSAGLTRPCRGLRETAALSYGELEARAERWSLSGHLRAARRRSSRPCRGALSATRCSRDGGGSAGRSWKTGGAYLPLDPARARPSGRGRCCSSRTPGCILVVSTSRRCRGPRGPEVPWLALEDLGGLPSTNRHPLSRWADTWIHRTGISQGLHSASLSPM